ncbi:hypothetical protein DL93DRAFT_219814 [Clavulina sp. PMI_390]|nr:hypothetical protein DL93DRAFT_219814 [Clavulina sp. PMI_390]
MKASAAIAFALVGVTSTIASPVKSTTITAVEVPIDFVPKYIPVEGHIPFPGVSKRSDYPPLAPRANDLVTLMTCASFGCTGTCFGHTMPPTQYGVCYATLEPFSSAFVDSVTTPTYTVLAGYNCNGQSLPVSTVPACLLLLRSWWPISTDVELLLINKCYNINPTGGPSGNSYGALNN